MEGYRLDADLASIQEVRDLVRAAKQAQLTLATYSQEQVDAICAAMARAGAAAAAELGQAAYEETGFGRPEDKELKNRFASQGVWDAIRDMRTVGIIAQYPDRGITEIGVPMGVIAGVVPSTNPTSTAIFKSLIAVKSGNALVLSPHPAAKRCTQEATRLMVAAGEKVGLPAGAISCISQPTLEAAQTLMKHPDVALVLATGGGEMVKTAYSSGNPAIGVGPGNGPAFIERTADIPAAVRRIMESKTFDNGTICATEQSVVTEDIIKGEVVAEFKRQGGYFLDPVEKDQVGAILMRPSGSMNPAVVGQSATRIAEMAGFSVPNGTRVLLGLETEVGFEYPYSREKLCTVLGFYTAPDWVSACELCIEILTHEGAGHTMTIHSRDEAVIREFGLKKPVSRLLVNTAASVGAVGATTGLLPSFTLGCGAVGGNSSSDNIGPMNLINIRRMARGQRELAELRGPTPLAGDTPLDTEALVQLVLEKLMGGDR